MKAYPHLTEKQMQLLRLLFTKSKPLQLFTVNETQNQLAKELGVTRQALNVHLRRLREESLIRTGRGFIDLTERALEMLGAKKADVFVLVSIEPKRRTQVYNYIANLPVRKLYRVTGDVDLVVIVNQSILDDFLRKLSKVEGIISTKTHVVIESLK